jgi:hypothetical protein
MLVILATQEAEIRRIAVQGQPRQIILETLAQKNPSHKWAGGVAEGVGPEFKPQYHKKKKKKKEKEGLKSLTVPETSVLITWRHCVWAIMRQNIVARAAKLLT